MKMRILQIRMLRMAKKVTTEMIRRILIRRRTETVRMMLQIRMTLRTDRRGQMIRREPVQMTELIRVKMV